MSLKDVVTEAINSCTENAFTKLQSVIRNQIMNTQDIKMVQNAFTTLLKEKEKENCEFMLESIQVFVQKYHSQLLDWLYILFVHLIIRQSFAKMDNHLRALQDTIDMLRILFPQRVLLQLCCKLVTDNVQTKESVIKISLLKFIRLLVVSVKPEILSNTFPDFVMAISRILSWTVDFRSGRVRKESETVIHKFFNLNPTQFYEILKSLPVGFQERAKIVLKDNVTFGSFSEKQLIKTESLECIAQDLQPQKINSITLATNETVYPRPGLFEMSHVNSQQRYMTNTNHDVRMDSQVNTLAKNSATVTYDDAQQIMKDFKIVQKNQISRNSSQTNEFKKELNVKNKSSKKFKSKNKLSLSTTKVSSEEWNISTDSLSSEDTYMKLSKNPKKKTKKTNINIQMEDSNELIKSIIQELSRYNERHQERKMSLISLIKCIHSDNRISWDTYFKTVMSLLLETLGDNEGGTRKLAVLSIQELAKVEPQRFQDQIQIIINKLLHCFMDTDQGVIEAIRSCVIIFSQYLNVDTLWRTLNIIIVENENEVQPSGLKFMQYVINASSPVIVSTLLIETLSLLNKLTIHKNMKNRKNSIYCLIAIYKKIGDRIWPHLKNFEKNKIRLLQIYIRRLK